ncbi:hypothetical protein DNL40_12815 [Xylanimonas oleitrophica]|uniref:Heparan-alpha-glucosaminide N-acetyltransferase catalytic domain-containing protein n=1 Tax=Xylanimonas oleitrophica TaxID=2607479 RepID=A0A2W5WM80_9MICO|nr:heparan-alpha-glucosaminide N-acetyltransferase domain-containing protein [Xylanimonas oleitrophica]PZR52300.1 hypothetical protein DNL40_12815 [Xylanimonas oleitrophica]
MVRERRHLAERLLGGPGRVAGVDVARGLAVLGMFTAHVGVTSGDLGTVEGWLSLAHGRSSILFATVAGVSLALVTGGRTPLDGEPLVRARLRLLVRALCLLAVGAVLDALGTRVFVILGFYAAYFVLALPALRLPARRLAAIAVVVAVVGPVLAYWGPEAMARAGLRLPRDGDGAVTYFLLTGHYPAVVWMAFVLAGLAVGRCDLGSDRLRTGLVVGGFSAWSASALASAALTAAAGGRASIEQQVTAASSLERSQPWAWDAPWPPVAGLLLDGPHDDTTLEALGSGGFALAVLGLCLHVGRPAARVLAPLAATGALALTVYTAHIVAVWGLRLLGLDLLVPESNVPLAVMVLVTLAAATTWRALVGRGPLERLVGWVAARAASARPARGGATGSPSP